MIITNPRLTFIKQIENHSRISFVVNLFGFFLLVLGDEFYTHKNQEQNMTNEKTEPKY